eukprot:915111-Prorocentrum_lima.AAC.1
MQGAARLRGTSWLTPVSSMGETLSTWSSRRSKGSTYRSCGQTSQAWCCSGPICNRGREHVSSRRECLTRNHMP